MLVILILLSTLLVSTLRISMVLSEGLILPIFTLILTHLIHFVMLDLHAILTAPLYSIPFTPGHRVGFILRGFAPRTPLHGDAWIGANPLGPLTPSVRKWFGHPP